MSNIFALLAEGGVSAGENVINQGYQTFIGIVNIILPAVIAVLLVIGMFYGIQLGVRYAKAEEEDERKKMRQSLINVIVGVVIAIVFVAVIEIILNMNFVKQLFYPLENSNVTGNSKS